MARITNDDAHGNYFVEFYSLKRRVAQFQTRTLEDAKEEAWRHYRSRNQSTDRITTKILVSQISRSVGAPRSTWERTATQDILPELRQRWDAQFRGSATESEMRIEMVEEEIKPTGESAETEIAATCFTRGPWSAHAMLSGSENHKGWRVYAATGYPVAEVYPLNSDPSPAALANKRLITHGPDLYDAAKVALNIIETGDPRDAVVFLQQALALVDGNQETK